MKKMISFLLLVMFTSFSFISDIAKQPIKPVKIYVLDSLKFEKIDFTNDTFNKDFVRLDKKLKRCELKINEFKLYKKTIRDSYVADCDTTNFN